MNEQRVVPEHASVHACPVAFGEANTILSVFDVHPMQSKLGSFVPSIHVP